MTAKATTGGRVLPFWTMVRAAAVTAETRARQAAGLTRAYRRLRGLEA